jgi:hypothetical protein
MAKKIYVDARTSVNNGQSQLGLNNQIDLKKYIQSVITESTPEPVSEWTETLLTITPLQILNSKETPIVLLPDMTEVEVDKYYVIDYILFEFKQPKSPPNTTYNVDVVSSLDIKANSYAIASLDKTILTASRFSIVRPHTSISPAINYNGNITLSSKDNAPTLGDIPLTAKIKYKIITLV